MNSHLHTIAFQQPYFNVAHSLKQKLNETLGHRLASAWLDLFDISHSGKKIIEESYCYLASVWGYSRRHVIRIIHELESAGFIRKTIHKKGKIFNKENSYEVCTPATFFKEIESFPKRKQVIPDFDYSVNHESIPGEDENNAPAQDLISKVSNKELSYDGPVDTRNLLDTSVKAPSGLLGDLLARMKDKFKPGPKPEAKGQGFHIYPQGGSDKTVTDQELNINNNRDTPSGRPVSLPKKKKSESRSISKEALVRIERFVMANKEFSAPQKLVEEAKFFIETNTHISEEHAINTFIGLVNANEWTTPSQMRYKPKIDEKPDIQDLPPNW